MTKPGMTTATSISFEQDMVLVDKLLGVLSHEQTSLVAGDIDALEGLLDEKSALLQSINGAVTSRYELLAKNGFEANETGITAWLAKQGKPVLDGSWTNFQKALAQAKEMNRLNGMLITRHSTRNQQMLSQLQGTTSNTGVYGRNGQAASATLSRGTLIA